MIQSEAAQGDAHLTHGSNKLINPASSGLEWKGCMEGGILRRTNGAISGR